MKNLSSEFLALVSDKTLIVGVGNILKGDDGVGVALLKRLEGLVDAQFLECGIAPENYLGKITHIAPKTLIVIDAVDLGEIPGTMRIVRPAGLAEGGPSTHSLSPAMFIEYLEKRLEGVRILMLAIQPKSCRLGECMSKEVSQAINEFLDGLQKEF